MVHHYPRLMDVKSLMSVLAEQLGEPSVQSLMEPNGLTDAQHTANWETVVDLVKTGRAAGFHASAASCTSNLTSTRQHNQCFSGVPSRL